MHATYPRHGLMLVLALSMVPRSEVFAMDRQPVAAPDHFRYRDASPTGAGGVHTHTVTLAPLTGEVHVYGTFAMGRENPVPAVGGETRAVQTITLGQRRGDEFVPALRFGMTDGRNLPVERGHITPWVNDGRLDYFGAYARPETPYDFRVQVDVKHARASVWTVGRGDDNWFLLAEAVPLINAITAISEVVVEQHPGAPGISEFAVRATPWPAAEALRPHPHAKANRVVRDGASFRFQSMRSVWRQPERHVTVARKPPVWMGFPDVVQVDEKTLVCTFNDGSGHGGGGRLLVARSEDLGRTWGAPVALHDTGSNCPRVQRLKDGSLLVLHDLGGRIPQFFRSRDGGKTWTEQPRLDPTTCGGNQVCVPSRVTELPDGSWLLVGSWYPGGKAWEGTEGERLEFYRSTDEGQTWQFWSFLQAFPPHSLSEASLLTLPDRRLMLYAREARSDGHPGVKAVSSDQGKTWSQAQDLPFAITGRTCAGFLKDGRVIVTFRSGIGRSALWAWVGRADDETGFRIAGAHVNDRHSVGLKDGVLHLDNDAACGQFTQYFLRPPDSPESTIDVTAEVQVVANAGQAATLSVPFVGRLRLFPDHAVFAHAPDLRVACVPGQFHTIRVLKQGPTAQVFVDGREALATEKLDGAIERVPWTPATVSAHAFSFGNEPPHGGSTTNVYAREFTPALTGYSLWRRVTATLDDPRTGRHTLAWSAADGFPDQYQLDHIVEIDATVDGHDQGYSGWRELTDGRLFFANYTDDTAPTCPPTGVLQMGVAWIRGTFVRLEDLPPTR